MEGFRVIGRVEWAELLAEAMSHFGTPYPRDRGDREVLLARRQGRSREEWDPFRELDERFFESTDDWEDSANAYAAQALAAGGG